MKIRTRLGQIGEGQACPPGMTQKVLKRGVVMCRLKDRLTWNEVRWLLHNLPQISEKEIKKRLLPAREDPTRRRY